MGDLESSSAHREKGLMSPNDRMYHLRRILRELRTPDQISVGMREPGYMELNAAQDLCYRIYSAEVSDLIASRLGVTRQQVREALDAALKWKIPNGGQSDGQRGE